MNPGIKVSAPCIFENFPFGIGLFSACLDIPAVEIVLSTEESIALSIECESTGNRYCSFSKENCHRMARLAAEEFVSDADHPVHLQLAIRFLNIPGQLFDQAAPLVSGICKGLNAVLKCGYDDRQLFEIASRSLPPERYLALYTCLQGSVNTTLLDDPFDARRIYSPSAGIQFVFLPIPASRIPGLDLSPYIQDQRKVLSSLTRFLILWERSDFPALQEYWPVDIQLPDWFSDLIDPSEVLFAGWKNHPAYLYACTDNSVTADKLIGNARKILSLPEKDAGIIRAKLSHRGAFIW